MTDQTERLIEQWLPINEISVEAIREGGALAGHPPVNQLHVWWARRPLIASRATVAASMLPIDTRQGEIYIESWNLARGCESPEPDGYRQGRGRLVRHLLSQ